MRVKVIYTDGTFGMVKASTIGELMKTSKIIAFNSLEGWVEVRRKRNIDYKGQERRIRSLY